MASQPQPPQSPLGYSLSSSSSIQAQSQQPELQGEILRHHQSRTHSTDGSSYPNNDGRKHASSVNATASSVEGGRAEVDAIGRVGNTVNAAAQTIAVAHNPPPEIPTLYPPELFATIHDGIYRCTSVDINSRDFLKTLSLKTILTLNVEKPRSPLRNLCSSLSIQLIHSALWTGASPGTTLSSSTTTTTQPIWEEPAWKQAVDDALAYLAPSYRPVLVVDGVGVFCGVVRRGVMGWGITGTILEYRSFFWGGGGQGGRYGCEEVVEMVDVDVDGGWGGSGVDDLRVTWDEEEQTESENKEEEEDGGIDKLAPMGAGVMVMRG